MVQPISAARVPAAFFLPGNSGSVNIALAAAFARLFHEHSGVGGSCVIELFDPASLRLLMDSNDRTCAAIRERVQGKYIFFVFPEAAFDPITPYAFLSEGDALDAYERLPQDEDEENDSDVRVMKAVLPASALDVGVFDLAPLSPRLIRFLVKFRKQLAGTDRHCPADEVPSSPIAGITGVLGLEFGDLSVSVRTLFDYYFGSRIGLPKPRVLQTIDEATEYCVATDEGLGRVIEPRMWRLARSLAELPNPSEWTLPPDVRAYLTTPKELRNTQAARMRRSCSRSGASILSVNSSAPGWDAVEFAQCAEDILFEHGGAVLVCMRAGELDCVCMPSDARASGILARVAAALGSPVTAFHSLHVGDRSRIWEAWGCSTLFIEGVGRGKPEEVVSILQSELERTSTG